MEKIEQNFQNRLFVKDLQVPNPSVPRETPRTQGVAQVTRMSKNVPRAGGVHCGRQLGSFFKVTAL